MTIRIITSTTLALALAACGTVPEPSRALDSARDRLQAAQIDTQVSALAPAELGRAAQLLRAAEKARLAGASAAEVDHLAYLSSQRVTIAQETAWSLAAQAVTAGASAERDKLLLAQRSNEVVLAQRDTQQAQRETEQARRDTGQAQRELAASQQGQARASTELALADANALRQQDLMQGRIAQRDARLGDLESQLRDLSAKQTERGVVVTLGDVLFDSGQATLLADSGGSMAKLAAFLRNNPLRSARIEGHTDNLGGDAANLALSDRRAQSVLAALVDLGVASSRLAASGRGEQAPTASNLTAAGRQLNRRVEILISPRPEDVSSR